MVNGVSYRSKFGLKAAHKRADDECGDLGYTMVGPDDVPCWACE